MARSLLLGRRHEDPPRDSPPPFPLDARARPFAPLPRSRAAPDAALHAMQRLRYEVYCLEQRFVDAARCTDGRESDDYDLHAIHFAAATDRGEVVATLRLVLDSPLGFPLERYAAGLLDHRPGTERPRTGEVSRLIIATRYRSATIREPLILFGLFRHLYEESWRMGLDYLLAAMEPRAGAAPPPARLPVRAAGRSHQLLRPGHAVRRAARGDAAGLQAHPRLSAELRRGRPAALPLFPRELGPARAPRGWASWSAATAPSPA